MQTVAMRIEGRDSCGVFANVGPPDLRVIEYVSRSDCLIRNDPADLVHSRLRR